LLDFVLQHLWVCFVTYFPRPLRAQCEAIIQFKRHSHIGYIAWRTNKTAFYRVNLKKCLSRVHK